MRMVLLSLEDSNFRLIRRENVIRQSVDNNWRDLTVENGSINYLKSRGISETRQNLRDKFKNHYIASENKEMPC